MHRRQTAARNCDNAAYLFSCVAIRASYAASCVVFYWAAAEANIMALHVPGIDAATFSACFHSQTRQVARGKQGVMLTLLRSSYANFGPRIVVRTGLFTRNNICQNFS